MIYKDIRSYLELPDYFSIMGLVFSMLSILYIINQEFITAFIFILISTALDYSDGKISRKINRKGNFGVILDSLCDVVLYLVAIVIFGFVIGLDSTFSVMVFMLFMAAGILRLTRFSITGILKGYYIGLPVGVNIVIPLIYFIFLYFGVDVQYLIWFYLLSSMAMISTIKVRKI